jgi:hypothetical protein
LSDTEREIPAEYVPTADQRALVENAAAFGFTQADSAEQLKIDEKTGNVKKVWLLARRGSLEATMSYYLVESKKAMGLHGPELVEKVVELGLKATRPVSRSASIGSIRRVKAARSASNCPSCIRSPTPRTHWQRLSLAQPQARSWLTRPQSFPALSVHSSNYRARLRCRRHARSLRVWLLAIKVRRNNQPRRWARIGTPRYVALASE